jgi:hypothetical protein
MNRRTVVRAQAFRHQQWLSTGGAEGARLDLSRAQLRNFTLAETNFRLAVLREAELAFSYVTNLDFSRADLRRANLRQVHFIRCILNRSDLRCATLAQAMVAGDVAMVGVRSNWITRMSARSICGLTSKQRQALDLGREPR